MIMPKATVTKNTFWTKAKQHKCFYFADGTQNSADGKRNPTGCCSLPSLPPLMYMRACVCTKQRSVLRRYFCESLWSLFPLNNNSPPIFTTAKIPPGQGSREAIRENLSIHGLPLTCDMPLDRQVCSFFFPCKAQSFILILDPQGGGSSSL